jgi:hypothetical protein
MNQFKRLAKVCITLRNSLSAYIGRKKSLMSISQSASDHAADARGYGQALGGVITGAQNAAMQSAAYNGLLQNAHIAKPFWREGELSAPSVGINIERASNGYIIRSNGSSTVATTLEEVQQHVTAIVVSNLVLDGVK